MSRKDFKQTRKAMSQPAVVCQDQLKEKIEFCRDKEFFYHDITKEECKEDCRDTLNSVTTMIKENGRGTV